MKGNRLTLISLLAAFAAMPAAAKYHAKKAPAKTDPAAQYNALIKAGESSLDRFDYAAAIDSFTKAVKAHGTSGGYFLLGYAHYQRGFIKGAPETADKADAAQVIDAYSTAVALDPNLKEVQMPYKLYHGLAMAYEATGANDKALDAFKTALQLAPANPLIPLYAARLRLKMGDTPSSLANLDMSLKRAQMSGQQAVLLSFIKGSPMFAAMLQSPAHARLLTQYQPAVVVASAAPVVKRGSLASMTPKPASDAYGLRDSVRNTAPSKAPVTTAKDQAVLDDIAAANDEFNFRHFGKSVEYYNDAMLLNRQSATLSPGQEAFVQGRIGACYNKLGWTSHAVAALLRSVQVMPYNPAAHYQLALAYSVSGHYKDSMEALRETFKTAPNGAELRKFMLEAKTDSELDPIRDLPAFQAALDDYSTQAKTTR